MNGVYQLITKSRSKAISCSLIPQVIALAFADNAFENYGTVEELLEAPEGKIQWKRSILEIPFFRCSRGLGGSFSKDAHEALKKEVEE